MTTTIDQVADAARALDRAAAEPVGAAAGLAALRAVALAQSVLDGVRDRLVHRLQDAPQGSAEHASWSEIAAALDEPKATTYGRWSRTVRGLPPATRRRGRRHRAVTAHAR